MSPEERYQQWRTEQGGDGSLGKIFPLVKPFEDPWYFLPLMLLFVTFTVVPFVLGLGWVIVLTLDGVLPPLVGLGCALAACAWPFLTTFLWVALVEP